MPTDSAALALETPPARPARMAGAPAGWGRNIRGDCVGGALAAVVTVPLSIGFGLLAFAPLGEAYLPAGIIAGLHGAIFLGLIVAVKLLTNLGRELSLRLRRANRMPTQMD